MNIYREQHESNMLFFNYSNLTTVSNLIVLFLLLRKKLFSRLISSKIVVSFVLSFFLPNCFKIIFSGLILTSFEPKSKKKKLTFKKMLPKQLNPSSKRFSNLILRETTFFLNYSRVSIVFIRIYSQKPSTEL